MKRIFYIFNPGDLKKDINYINSSHEEDAELLWRKYQLCQGEHEMCAKNLPGSQ